MLHGTCVAFDECGILLRGPSGSGKSDLALRLIETPPKSAGSVKLVADDQVIVTCDEDQLIASSPEVLRGVLEVRGIGLIEVACRDAVALKLVVELSGAGAIERLPDLANCNVSIQGLALPVLKLDPFESSAPAKLALAVSSMGSLFSR